MHNFLLIAALVVIVAVVGVLLFGLFSMARGGEKDKKYSNKMMQWRVGLQALAVFLLFLAWVFGSK